MISPVRVARSYSPSPTVADARSQPPHLRPQLLSRETAINLDEGLLNPLWIVAIGMAVFFTVAAFMILVL